MKSSEKLYYSERKVRYFWGGLFLTVLAIYIYQGVTLETLVKNPRFHASLSFALGLLFISSLLAFFQSEYRPKVRICEHFLMSNYDNAAVNWSQLESVTLEGTSLILQVQEEKCKSRHSMSLSHIPQIRELIDDIREMCGVKGIPFEEKPKSRRERMRGLLAVLVIGLIAGAWAVILYEEWSEEECLDLSGAVANYCKENRLTSVGCPQFNSDGTVVIFFTDGSSQTFGMVDGCWVPVTKDPEIHHLQGIVERHFNNI